MPHRSHLALFVLVALAGPSWAQGTDDAMARARRVADGPMRVILQAGQMKTRRSDAEATARATPRPAPKAVEPAPPAAGRAPDPAAPGPKQVEDGAGGMPGAQAGEPPAAATERPEPALAGVAPVASDSAAALQIEQMVEPVIPRALLAAAASDLEAVVAFTVNADGSTSAAQVQSSSDRRFDAAVLDAVAQWRFAPITAPRPHTVQLVIRRNE